MLTADGRVRSEVLDTAMRAVRTGLSVVPPRQDGSKAPRGEWKRWLSERPDERTVRAWYREGLTGLGVVCGAVSGGLECLEFEEADAWEMYRESAARCGLGDLLGRVAAGYSERPPRGGVHLLWRCTEVGGNQKLARRRYRDGQVKAVIETRGEGGYVILAPSGGTVHPSGRPYVLFAGSVETIETVTPEERRGLLDLARTLDEPERVEHHQARTRGVPAPPAGTNGSGRPGDDYSARTTWAEVLSPHGWTHVYDRGEVGHWRRPGKDRGVSATTNHAGSELLYVFSSSTAFDVDRGYSRFSAYAVLNHGGDFEAAARELGRKGFGEPARPERKAVLEPPARPEPPIEAYEQDQACPQEHAMADADSRGPLQLADTIPQEAWAVLGASRGLMDLFRGQSKPEGGDRSSGGYDWAVCLGLIRAGVTSPDVIGSVLWHRPDGAARRRGRAYIERTVARALAAAAAPPPPAEDDLPVCDMEPDRIVVYDSDPPRIELHFDARSFALTVEELLSPSLFTRRVVAALLRVPAIRAGRGGQRWAGLVNGWLARAERIEQPEEASEDAAGRHALEQALANMARADDLADTRRGCIVWDDDHDHVCLTALERVVAMLVQVPLRRHVICAHLRRLGWGPASVRSGDVVLRLWRHSAPRCNMGVTPAAPRDSEDLPF